MSVKFIVLVIAAFVVLSNSASAQIRKPCPEVRCESIKQDIRHTESLLRQGHSNATGKRHRLRLKNLRERQRQFCR